MVLNGTASGILATSLLLLESAVLESIKWISYGRGCARVCVCACVGGDKPFESTQREALLTCTFDVFRFLIFFFQINYIHESLCESFSN